MAHTPEAEREKLRNEIGRSDKEPDHTEHTLDSGLYPEDKVVVTGLLKQWREWMAEWKVETREAS